MSPRRLLLRSLQYHKGIHIAVALGVAVGAATLAGAFIVGDSVRESLRNLTLDRLGRIDEALVADRYFRAALAGELPGETAPAILIRGSAEAADTGARASQVNLQGVDEHFWAMFPGSEAPELGLRDVAVNQSLAHELGVEAGAALLLRFQTDTLVPSESVMGRKTENVRTLRVTVKAVLPDRGPGRFGLQPSQQLPLNAFLSLTALQRALEQQGKANALLATAPEGLDATLREKLELVDLELDIEPIEVGVRLQTGRIVL
ncbi:MAG: ABC transporter permease, partial [Bryobacterales bacterium]